MTSAEPTTGSTADIGRGARWLWSGAAVLLALSAHLLIGDPSTWLYLMSAVVHPLLALGLGIAWTLWWWPRRSFAPLAGGLLVAATACGLVLVVLGNCEALRPLLWAQHGLALAGLLALLFAVRSRGAWWTVSALALIALGALILFDPGSRNAEERVVNPRFPLTMAERAMGGEDGPFYPSALGTESGGILSAAQLASPESCGRAGCHPDAVAEWSSSAHRYAGLANPWYRAVLDQARQDLGEVPTRWCAGCHTPALLASGGADRPPAELADDPLATSGVSCIACHGAQVESTLGQADLVLASTPVHQLVASSSSAARAFHGLVLRLAPEVHRRAFAPRPADAGSAELCSACHSGSMQAPVNAHYPYKMFDDYGMWQVSSVSGQSVSRSFFFPPPQNCVDCHMAPSEGADGGARSHRFAAANTALPAWSGDEAQLEAVESFLQDEKVRVDLFAMLPGNDGDDGPIILQAPLDRLEPTVTPGRTVRFDVVVQNRAVGHIFPGGKIDQHDIWLELRAVDENGRTVFWSGRAEEGERAAPGSHRYGVARIDGEGRPIERYDHWNVRTDVWAHMIEPGDAEVVRFRLTVPEDASSLTVTARLNHRKFPPELNRWVFEKLGEPVPSSPVVVLGEDTVTVEVVPTDAASSSKMVLGESDVDVDRWLSYGLGTLLRADRPRARTAFQLILDHESGNDLARVGLAWLLRLEKDYAGSRRILEAALEDGRGMARIHASMSLVERAEGRLDEAVEHLRLALVDTPRDIGVRRRLAQILFQKGEYDAAIAEYEAVLAIDPQDDRSHFGLMRAYTAVKDDERAEYHKTVFEGFQFGQEVPDMVRRWTEAHPEEAAEQPNIHEHESLPLPAETSSADAR